ncbi:hypothetical protein [Alteromonas halophila]|uniref:Uncharacterized protein n=1 Tax=Alteromonas halophila TaxID=516698 RepID=A0A918MXV5_9ALTE|nr:hypothetical protein [Alteromonas halophila]GGW81415.1 hypothetical protein GCM10007391_13240 [Alteromonas halophila]
MRPDKDLLTYLLAVCIGLTALVTGQRDNTVTKASEPAASERAVTILTASPRQADQLLVRHLKAQDNSASVYPL